MTEIKRSISIVLVFLAVLMAIMHLRTPNSVKASAKGIGPVSSHRSTVTQNSQSDSDKLPYLPTQHNTSVSDSAVATPLSLENALEADIFGIAYTLSDPVEITESEKEMIAATIQLEVLGKYSRADQFENPDLKYYEMLAVAQVIRNRLLSDMFPSDVYSIIHASEEKPTGRVYQFSTSPYISSTSPSALAYTAVDEVFDHGVSVLPEDYCYFCATWREAAFEINNRAVLKYVGDVEDFDKIVADATTFYAAVTMAENIKNGYVF